MSLETEMAIQGHENFKLIADRNALIRRVASLADDALAALQCVEGDHNRAVEYQRAARSRLTALMRAVAAFDENLVPSVNARQSTF